MVAVLIFRTVARMCSIDMLMKLIIWPFIYLCRFALCARVADSIVCAHTSRLCTFWHYQMLIVCRQKIIEDGRHLHSRPIRSAAQIYDNLSLFILRDYFLSLRSHWIAANAPFSGIAFGRVREREHSPNVAHDKCSKDKNGGPENGQSKNENRKNKKYKWE